MEDAHMARITDEMKKEFLKIRTGEEYMAFQSKYHMSALEIGQDPELAKKMADLIRMAPGSRGDGTGNHEELKRKTVQ